MNVLIEKYVNCLVLNRAVNYLDNKINPGSNRNKDDDLKNATSGMRNVEFPDPKMLDKGEFQCTVCNAIFKSKEACINHVMSRHQNQLEEIREKPIMYVLKHEFEDQLCNSSFGARLKLECRKNMVSGN